MNETNNQQERFVDLAWLAGLYEGEGTFTLVQGSGNRICPRIEIINTDMVLIEQACAALKRLNIGHYILTRKGGCAGKSEHKDVKIIYVAGMKRVKTFLDTLLSYLRGNKIKVATLVYEFVKRRLSLPRNSPYTAEDLNDINVVRFLNQKGTRKSSETIRWVPGAANSNRYNYGKDIVQVA